MYCETELSESALTAVPKSHVTTKLLKTLSVALAETSGKPESVIMPLPFNTSSTLRVARTSRL